MKLLNVPDSAKALGVSTRTIRRAINAGELRWINVALSGERVQIRIDENDLRAWTDARASKPRNVA